MKLSKTLLFTLVILGGVLTAKIGVSARNADNSTIIEFTSLAPVTPPFTGATNAIRGVPGAGLPWTITDSVHGQLRANGKLDISIEGLVLADDPLVPANLRLTNPVPSFRATVSCLSIDSNKLPSTVNVSTDAFPASPAGDSEIETAVSLPSPCIAPIVFVTTPNGAWLAVSGH